MGNENPRWREASDVISIFPTLVWKVELEAQLRQAIGAQALAALARMRRDLTPLAPGQGWQSVQSLHELDDFRDLVSCVHRVVPGILRFLRIGCDAYQITACWATVLARGAAHKMHQHPNNFLSCVYYVRTHPGADTINFHDPRNQTGIIRPPVVELTAENTDQVIVRVKNGTMLVFPAYLQHSVDASASEDERISISFNIMFSAFTENLTKPLWGAAAAPTRSGTQSSALPHFVKHAVLTRAAQPFHQRAGAGAMKISDERLLQRTGGDPSGFSSSCTRVD
jgi:uncharacterized protein (TIGR02466 family)